MARGGESWRRPSSPFSGLGSWREGEKRGEAGPRARRKERVPTGPAPERELQPGWGKGAGLTCLARPSWFTLHPICHPLAHTPPPDPSLNYSPLSPPRAPSLRAGHTLLVSTFFSVPFFQNLSPARQLPPVFSGSLRSKPPSSWSLWDPCFIQANSAVFLRQASLSRNQLGP